MIDIDKNSELTEAVIKQLINGNVITYTNSKDRIISDFRGEKGFTAAYNGRQLLELLQNADDAHTEKVLMHIDTDQKILSIADNGTSFDAKGLRSLMLANMSSKNKREFIGNKGLGFRSILNWVKSVKIKTKGFILEFSPEIAKREFEKIIKDPRERESIISNEKDLAEGEIPFAILAIPDYKIDTEIQVFSTVIELNYIDSEEPKILEQLKTITPQVLLFLNHIREIEIKGYLDINNKLVLKEDSILGKKRVSVNDITWNIYYSGEKNLPNKRESFYAYKIAWQDNLVDKDTCFSTYFPTKVATHLPCLIHATFDLDPSRNYLNKSDDNEYILSRIAQSLSDIAENEIKNESFPDWKAYQFLTIDGRSENRLLDSFYIKIELLKSDAAIYPTIDGKYKKKNEVFFFGNKFSEWVIRNKVGSYFENLLLPVPDFIELQPYFSNIIYSRKSWQNIILNITEYIISVNERVELIALLLDEKIKKVLQDANLPLLLDEQQNIVRDDIEVFTLKQASIIEYEIPAYVNIAFLDDNLYKKLIERFAYDIERLRVGPEDKSRPLKRLISPIVNLGSNDITDVIRNITRAYIDKTKEEGFNLTFETKNFVKCLFNIFKRNPDRRGTLVDTIYLVNRNLEKAKASDLFLGREYPTGASTEQIFDGIYSDEDYLAGNDFWQLKSENDNFSFIEDFFIWLGVNRYTKFINETKQKDRWQEDDYIRFVFDNVGRPDIPSYKTYKVQIVDNFEKVISSPRFSVEKLAAWILKDRSLNIKIDNEENEEDFEYTYNNNRRPVRIKPSYFLFQIHQSNIIKDLFVDFEFADLLSVKTIDTNHELFKTLHIDSTAVSDLLRRLGAKMSFNDLEIEKVYSLLNVQQIEHSKARKIYQLAFSYFKNNSSLNYGEIAKQSNLLAVKNSIREYRPTNEVYYSDNTTLPSKIREDFWIFDFPKRSGEKQVAEYFGVKTFKDIIIEINDTIDLHWEYTRFNSWFNKIKPYILTYRLNSISKESIEKATVSNLKNVNVKLVSKLEYSIKGGGFKSILPNEFINKTKQEYYICADSSLSLDILKRTPAFCEAFAEILCVLFEVNECKDDFRSIFKDDFDLRDTKYLIQTKSLNEKFEDACRLLGLSSNELEFWRAISKIKEKEWDESVSSYDQLKVIVLENFNYNIPTIYSSVNFDSFDNQQSFDFLKDICNSLNITLEDMSNHLTGFRGLFFWHVIRMNNISMDIENLFAITIWDDLSHKGIEEQKQFLNKRDAFRSWFDNIHWTDMDLFPYNLELDYKSILKRKVNCEFKIDLIDKTDFIQIRSEYLEILNAYDEIEKSFNSEEKSILYFDGHADEVSKIVELHVVRSTGSIQDTNNDESSLPIIESKFRNATPLGAHNGISHRVWKGTYSPKRDREMRKAGKQAEEKVRDALVEKYGRNNVQWISGNSDEAKTDDTLGYDMLYREDESKEWNFLEVKSTSGNSFIISNNELDIAFKNKIKYHLALVRSGQIYIDKEFFSNSELENEYRKINSGVSIKPIDYEIFININQLKIEELSDMISVISN